MGWSRMVVTVLVGLGLASSASALSLQVTGPASASVGDQITLTVGLDASEVLTGYELFVSWDPSELMFVPTAVSNFVLGNLFPDSDLIISPEVFFTLPAASDLPLDPAGARFSKLILVTFGAETQDLFELNFQVLGGVDDGLMDFTAFQGTGGLSGPVGGVDPPLDNPAGFGALVLPDGLPQVSLLYLSVPEPGTLMLAALGLVGLAALGRRTPRS